MPYDHKQRSKQNRNHLLRILREPERAEAEARFAAEHASDTDEELMALVKAKKRELGKRMKPVNTVGYVYLQQRLGPWAVFMEQVNREMAAEKESIQSEITRGSENEN